MVDHHSGLPSRPLYRGGAREVKHADPALIPVDGFPAEKRVFTAFARVDQAQGLFEVEPVDSRSLISVPRDARCGARDSVISARPHP
jgi:hypothetical protein